MSDRICTCRHTLADHRSRGSAGLGCSLNTCDCPHFREAAQQEAPRGIAEMYQGREPELTPMPTAAQQFTQNERDRLRGFVLGTDATEKAGIEGREWAPEPAPAPVPSYAAVNVARAALDSAKGSAVIVSAEKLVADILAAQEQWTFTVSDQREVEYSDSLMIREVERQRQEQRAEAANREELEKLRRAHRIQLETIERSMVENGKLHLRVAANCDDAARWRYVRDHGMVWLRQMTTVHDGTTLLPGALGNGYATDAVDALRRRDDPTVQAEHELAPVGQRPELVQRLIEATQEGWPIGPRANQLFLDAATRITQLEQQVRELEWKPDASPAEPVEIKTATEIGKLYVRMGVLERRIERVEFRETTQIQATQALAARVSSLENFRKGAEWKA